MMVRRPDILSPASLFLFAGFVLLSVAGGTAAGRWRILKSWPQVSAEVLDSRVVGDQIGSYGAEIMLRFNANGTQYSASAGTPYLTSSYETMKRMVESYAPGSRRPIRYNPGDPKDIRLGAGLSPGFFLAPLICGALGLICAAIGAAARGRPGEAASTGSLKETLDETRRTRASKGIGPAAPWIGKILLLLGAALLLLAGWMARKKWVILSDWPQVEALVVGSRAAPAFDYGYELELELDYTVSGKRYLTRTASGERIAATTRSAERARAGHAPGTRLRIRYRPDDPNIVRVEAEHGLAFFFWPFVVALMGLGFAGLGLASILASRERSMMNSLPRPLWAAVLAFGLALIPDQIEAQALPAAVAASPAMDRVLLANSDGKMIGALEPDGSGFKVRDVKYRLVGRIRIEEGLVKLKNSKGVELWRIKRREDGAEIIAPSGRRLFRINTKEGRWSLEDSSGKELAECRPMDGGYEMRQTGPRAQAWIRRQEGRVLFETMRGWPSGPHGLPGSLEGSDNARAGMWFVLEDFSLPERASLFAYFLKVSDN